MNIITPKRKKLLTKIWSHTLALKVDAEDLIDELLSSPALDSIQHNVDLVLKDTEKLLKDIVKEKDV